MTRRIIIHAGFHKTATTTVQTFLYKNQKAISSDFQLITRKEIRPISNLSHKYSRNEYPKLIDDFKIRFTALLNKLLNGSDKDILISSEDFSGQIPGRSKAPNYDTAHIIVNLMHQIIRSEAPKLKHQFYFSLREKSVWIESVYWHLVSKSFLQDDFDDFKKQVEAKINLKEIVDELSSTIGQEYISSAYIEDYYGDFFGPMEPLLKLMYKDKPYPNELVMINDRNIRYPEDQLTKFLKINRMNIPREEKKKLKDQIKNRKI